MLIVYERVSTFERDLIREWTNADLLAACARGRKGGRPLKGTLDKIR